MPKKYLGADGIGKLKSLVLTAIDEHGVPPTDEQVEAAVTEYLEEHPIEFDAADTNYDNTESGLTADNVQAAIDELANGSGGGTAADTTYDNSDSGLTADNVQDALDEINNKIPTGDLADLDEVAESNLDSALAEKINGKVDVNQGAANAGKVLGIGSDGIVVPVTGGGGGQDGKSAYELAVQQGYVGTLDQWLASLHGADGADGTDGTDGTDGVSPTVAVTDISGGHRVTITDAQGPHVFDVMDGQGGGGGGSTDIVAPAWDADETYEAGECVVCGGKLWKCILQHSGEAPEEGTYWTEITVCGELGGIKLGVDQGGSYGYYKADGSFAPFRAILTGVESGNSQITVNLGTKPVFVAVFGVSNDEHLVAGVVIYIYDSHSSLINFLRYVPPTNTSEVNAFGSSIQNGIRSIDDTGFSYIYQKSNKHRWVAVI